MLHGDLRAAGLARGALLYTDLLPFDQNHYHGVAELERMTKELGLGAGQVWAESV